MGDFLEIPDLMINIKKKYIDMKNITKNNFSLVIDKFLKVNSTK